MIWKPNTTVAVIAEREGRFLMVEETSDGRVVFNQPAGHLDEGETLAAAAVRETFEESAWHVELQAITGIYQWRKPPQGPTFLRICYAAHATSHDPTVPLDEEIIGTHWFSRDEVAARESQLRSPMVLRCIDDYLSGQRFPLDLIAELRCPAPARVGSRLILRHAITTGAGQVAAKGSNTSKDGILAARKGAMRRPTPKWRNRHAVADRPVVSTSLENRLLDGHRRPTTVGLPHGL